MKTFIILISFVVAVIAQTEENKCGFKRLFRECMEQEAVTEKMPEIWNQMKSANATQSVKCLQACVLEKWQIMVPPDFNIDLDAVKKFQMNMTNNNEEKVNQMQEVNKECFEQVKSTERCERANEFSRCLLLKLHGMGFKPIRALNRYNEENCPE